MNKTRIFIFLSLLMLLIAAVGELLISMLFPSFDTPVRYVIPFYFWVLYSVLILLLKSPLDTTSFSKYFMAFKSAKMVLSLFVVLILAFVMRSHAKGMVIAFFAYYILLLIPESAAVIYLKKHFK